MYLSYLMGAGNIKDNDLTSFGIDIEEKKSDGDRALKIPEDKLSQYIELIKSRLTNGFWNEIVGANKILFIFKFKNGSIREYSLSSENEREIDALCAEFNDESLPKVTDVYKWLAENKFYHDFMSENYQSMMNRK